MHYNNTKGVYTYLFIICFLIILPWIWIKFCSTNSVLLDEVDIKIPIYIQFANEQFKFPDLIVATQFQLDSELKHLTNKSLKVELIDKLENNLYEQNQSNFEDNYIVDLVLSDENSLAISSDKLNAYVLYTLDSIYANDLPFLISQTVLYHLIYNKYII
ncbi:unnamed protein product [Candida verbasci]|uniref:Uncharacterized protein n=1 Tax=Candida verbasci TaxID=1227364 RepID=A0A9W4TS53_9ASCO|nr:unnamed protein product [Candida verbasci]